MRAAEGRAQRAINLAHRLHCRDGLSVRQAQRVLAEQYGAPSGRHYRAGHGAVHVLAVLRTTARRLLSGGHVEAD